jgi:hypothetical protein
MTRLFRTVLAVLLVAAVLASTVSAQDRAAIVQRLRTELATLLKKDPAQLPTDRSVVGLGASDLTIIEWQMAAERTFRVDIADAGLFDPKTKTARKELTIASMADIVAKSPRWPQGRTR